MSRAAPRLQCGTPSDKCLCPELLRLYEANELPLYRGKVARNPLEASLRYPKGSLVASSKNAKRAGARRCIAQFDAYLRGRGHGTVWEEKVPEIRKFLEEALRQADLPVNAEGGLNRSAVLRQFGLRTCGASIVQSRAPALKDLLDEYDEQVDRSGQSQYKYAGYEGELREALARNDLKLTHGRLVSRRWLANRIGIPPSAMAHTPCLKRAIDEKQAEIDAGLNAGTSSKTVVVGGVSRPNLGPTPYSKPHGRVFDFTDLIGAYCQSFVERLATGFVVVAADLTDPKASYLTLRDFLGWLAGDSRVKPEVTRALRANRCPPKVPFEYATLVYREEHLTGLNGGNGRPKHPSFSIIEKLGHLGIFPEVSLPRRKRGGRWAERNGNARPTLAQAQVTDKSVLAVVAQHSVAEGMELPPSKDTIAFVNSLALERARRADLLDTLPEAIRVICEERIDTVRGAASAIFQKWRTIYYDGQRLLAGAVPGEEIGHTLRACSRKGERNREVNRFFPRANPEVALGNLLSLIRAEHDSVCPSAGTHGGDPFWSKTYAKVGGREYVQGHLLPTRLVVSAVALLYLCESGANISVALSLTNRALRASRKAGHMDVVGNKARSGGKPIYNSLARRSSLRTAVSAVEAMELLKEVVGACRKLREPAVGMLFVHPTRGRMSRLTEPQLREDTRRIISDSSLASLKVVPSMIRPTVLLAVQLRNPGTLSVAQSLAQHESPSTTMGYVNRLPHKLILAERTREFADRVQVEILATDRPQAVQTLSVRQRDTGMGVLCRDPLAGAQPDYPKGTSCQAVDRCVSCPQMIVAANPASIALMILWRDAIARAEPRWLEDRYDRWTNVWVPWKALCDVVLDQKMARGTLARVRRDAETLAEAIKQSDGFELPEPF